MIEPSTEQTETTRTDLSRALTHVKDGTLLLVEYPNDERA